MGTRKYYDRTLTLTSISGPTSPGLNTGGVYSVSPSLPAGAGTYQWLTPSNAVISGSGPSVTINFQSAGSYLVKCRHINNSGNAGSFISMTVTVSNISYIASSNGKFVYVSLQNNNGVQVAKQTVAYSLFIQSSGVLVASGKMPISGGTLDFSNVSGGIYILQIEIGVNSIETYRIFLK
jgi:hypothetical protein